MTYYWLFCTLRTLAHTVSFWALRPNSPLSLKWGSKISHSRSHICIPDSLRASLGSPLISNHLPVSHVALHQLHGHFSVKHLLETHPDSCTRLPTREIPLCQSLLSLTGYNINNYTFLSSYYLPGTKRSIWHTLSLMSITTRPEFLITVL